MEGLKIRRFFNNLWNEKFFCYIFTTLGLSNESFIIFEIRKIMKNAVEGKISNDQQTKIKS